MLAVSAESLTSASVVGGQAARAAEAEAVRERIASALGTRVSDRKLGDLMRLAHFQMLGREARAWRSPTAILARRPLRRAWACPARAAGIDPPEWSGCHVRHRLCILLCEQPGNPT